MAARPIPAVGEVVDGYKFLGGNPNYKENWEKAAPPPRPKPKPGEIIDGYRFKGGNPNDQSNWIIAVKPEGESGFKAATSAGYERLMGELVS